LEKSAMMPWIRSAQRRNTGKGGEKENVSRCATLARARGLWVELFCCLRSCSANLMALMTSKSDITRGGSSGEPCDELSRYVRSAPWDFASTIPLKKDG